MFWELSFAFFVLAFVGVLNNPAHYFGTYVLHIRSDMSKSGEFVMGLLNSHLLVNRRS